MTEILIKRLSKNIPLPKYETDGSSGMDIAADVNENIEIKPGKSEIIKFHLVQEEATLLNNKQRLFYLIQKI